MDAPTELARIVAEIDRRLSVRRRQHGRALFQAALEAWCEELEHHKELLAAQRNDRAAVANELARLQHELTRAREAAREANAAKVEAAGTSSMEQQPRSHKCKAKK